MRWSLAQRRPVLPVRDEEEQVLAVLARHVRQRTPAQLWTTALGGSVNAMLVWSQFPGLRWLAAGFGAVAAYGIGGLCELALADSADGYGRGRRLLLRAGRAVAVAAGFVGAAGAVLAFMAAALRGWQH